MGRGAARFSLGCLLAGGWIAVVAVCWHSVEEIHYLKGFYPRQFTVQEAYQAALVELIKVTLIALPILLGMGLALLLLRALRKDV